jgi:hypothetical protein
VISGDAFPIPRREKNVIFMAGKVEAIKRVLEEFGRVGTKGKHFKRRIGNFDVLKLLYYYREKLLRKINRKPYL